MEFCLITKAQARRFILRKQGLLGEHRFIGKEGILEYVKQAGCIQFDPIDVCGKNAELVLQSRVKGFTKRQLYELLYQDRKLIDYFDKNLAIMRTEDWPYLEGIREGYRQGTRGKEEVDKIAEEIKATIAEKGPVSSKDICYDDIVDWYWSSTKLARAALETLYFRGDLIVHHKNGTNKYYALAKDYIPEDILNAADPCPDRIEHLKWRILRRISAVGMLWNKPSDAWLGIRDLKADERRQVFTELKEEKKIIEFRVDGVKDSFYCLAEDMDLLRDVIKAETPEDIADKDAVEKKKAVEENAEEKKAEAKDAVVAEDTIIAEDTVVAERTRKNIAVTSRLSKDRVELIAPLDCMLWDRKLIKELFNFDYKWEIYTPEADRKYGYYTLPILKVDCFIGRCELVANYKAKLLTVKNLWLEDKIKLTKKLQGELKRCFTRFMKFHELNEIEYLVMRDEALP